MSDQIALLYSNGKLPVMEKKIRLKSYFRQEEANFLWKMKFKPFFFEIA